jgi:tetratricopeptide (TPR) repeat protein
LEIETATAAFADLREGRGTVLLLSGEPGIGKSTLARLIARLSGENGLPVFWGFAWEAGGAPAYWPWTQLLRSLTNEQPQHDVSRLGQILPESLSESETTILQPSQAQFQLLESVRQLLDTASRQSPIVLILEDLHAADADSLHLLNHLVRHIAAMPIFLVGTFRELEARTLPAMESLWRAARDAELVHLTQFDESEVREFLQSDGDAVPSPERVKQLYDVTQGNPLFLTELVGYLERTGSAAEKLPENVQQVIHQQLKLLPESTVRQLSIAAVLGREFSTTALSAMQQISNAAVSELLDAAIEAGIIAVTDAGTYRFAHVLHRDVLYQSIGTTDRQELHLRFAKISKDRIDDGDEDRWSTYAMHLQAAGDDHREEAIDAWRRAADRARDRLAFEDAATSLAKALSAFGEGPRSDPAERCKLLLQYAEVLQLTGEIATGQGFCRDAFEIAETLEQPLLMAEAALTWGGAIVVGKVDEEMIAALKASLSVLPDSDVACRSMVQARLAAALQPAVDPSGPMEMAREAIAMARTTDDDEVIYAVLRSGASALMDFAPARERILLNREVAEYAEKFGDFAGQFRSHLRLIIDASAIADRDLMDRAIEYCRRLARRIDLPHYQWRVASIRAMQATIDGRFADAAKLIDDAQALVDQISDLDARLTLPLQRFYLLCEWDSPETTPFSDIQTQLTSVFDGGLSATRHYVEPFLLALTESDDDGSIRELLRNDALVERTFSGGDRYSLSILGELATRCGDKALANRVYQQLKETEDDCSTTGLMAACWCGPIAWSLGIVLLGMGRVEEAIASIKKAQAVATRMQSRPYVARCHATLAEAYELAGDSQRALEHRERFLAIQRALNLRSSRRAPVATGDANVLPVAENLSVQQDGEIWHICFRGESTQLRDSKGLQMLAALVSRPDADVHVLELSGSDQTAKNGDAGPLLDDKARNEYRQRITTLQEDLDEANEMADIGRADEIRGELEFLTQELSRAFGLGGRKRSAGNSAERARVNVRRRLKDAIERISENAPVTGKYLNNTIKTGTYCRYSPT